ncbi:MAG: tRNA uridine-5-carboxymethylaminomethyl(34) synthesis GTPase MnmE, partial [Planctomycetota bacterium]
MSAASTIFAVSTAPGMSGVAVIRVSGPAAGESYKALTRRRELPKARYALYGPIFSVESGSN